MEATRKRTPLYRRPEELVRRLIGSFLELAIKTYGTVAAVSVALSDGETLGGKLYDAVAAVPNLMERYRQAKYVYDHAEEIRAALEYVHRHAPDARQLEAAVQRSYETLDSARRMFGEVSQAQESLARIFELPTGVLDLSLQAAQHLGKAWEAMPDLESITHLANVTQNVTPLLQYLNSLEIDFSSLYGGLLCFADNFARDEIAGTLCVMAAAFGIAFVLGLGAGFWARRGRPGFLVSLLQGWGARVFADWYGRNLEFALSRPLYAVARKRIQRDIVADPRKALDPEAHQELERYFERRLRER